MSWHMGNTIWPSAFNFTPGMGTKEHKILYTGVRGAKRRRWQTMHVHGHGCIANDVLLSSRLVCRSDGRLYVFSERE